LQMKKKWFNQASELATNTLPAQQIIPTEPLPTKRPQVAINVTPPVTEIPTTPMGLKQLVRNTCIRLFYDKGLSFRSIPGTFEVFNSQFTLGLKKLPHFTSVINWSLYLGRGLLNRIRPIEKPWAAVIDHSIGIGTNKALVVLRVPLDALSKRGSALCLADCECVGLKVVDKVNGEVTASDLKEIFDISGNPTVVIKDCDASLGKGVRLWAETQDEKVLVVEDLGHVVACGLKAEFESDEDFKSFIPLLGNGAKCLRQTTLAFLLPPILRKKGRFQGINRLAKWAEKILVVFKQRGRARAGSTLDRLRKAFPKFTQLEGFIRRFIQAAEVTAQMMKVLKNEGLTLRNHDECQQLLNQLPSGSATRTRLQRWLDTHIAVYKQLDEQPLMISSDIIESLFSRYKEFIARSPNNCINRTVLLIPGMCGTRSDAEMDIIIEPINHKHVEEWVKNNLSSSHMKNRRDFFKNIDAQKVGKFMTT
jgi:hypothetical protein